MCKWSTNKDSEDDKTKTYLAGSLDATFLNTNFKKMVHCTVKKEDVKIQDARRKRKIFEMLSEDKEYVNVIEESQKKREQECIDQP